VSSQVQAESFAPVAGQAPTVLILGTMPGQASLRDVQYYAHPRNAFWPIVLSAITGMEPDFASAHAIAYDERIELLKAHNLALWDVLARCERPGSLDSAIDRKSEVPNPLAEWISSQPSLKRVCFNGKTAAKLFTRHIPLAAERGKPGPSLEFITLPSTSPAMASLGLSAKTALWTPALLA